MVIKKNIVFFTLIFSLSWSVQSNEIIDKQKLNKIHANPFNDAYIISFDGSPSNFSIKKIKFLSDDDTYAIKVFGKDNKYLYAIGIGNPFYATYQHIGYEDRKYMGGPVSSAIIEIAIPLHIEPSSFIVSKRDITGKFKDIQEISFE